MKQKARTEAGKTRPNNLRTLGVAFAFTAVNEHFQGGCEKSFIVTPAKAGAQGVRRFRMIPRRAGAASKDGFFSVFPGRF
ncbi:hypothetical protein [Ectopseudomonas mendocina]|uniref:Uncharacterized protein n=1 Tax=Ectopseudomonas mendocina TaxID=300 RepID=A0A2R3QNZ9_ECTME|nr:hypothetical protein [Pseudomonas mendocina]AVO53477.1 hypothetical protein C7A17_12115 [Pseudomonas mendocina]